MNLGGGGSRGKPRKTPEAIGHAPNLFSREKLTIYLQREATGVRWQTTRKGASTLGLRGFESERMID